MCSRVITDGQNAYSNVKRQLTRTHDKLYELANDVVDISDITPKLCTTARQFQHTCRQWMDQTFSTDVSAVFTFSR